MGNILVIIPSYNCAAQVGRVIAQFDNSVAPYFAKVAVINNQSTDQTQQSAIEAFKANPQISGSVYTNMHNLGYGGSLKVGFNIGLEEGYDFVLILHGDDQGHIRDLMPYIIDGSINDFDCTLGARFHSQSTLENYSTFRTLGNKVFNIIFGLVLKKRILDLGSGINIYKLRAFQERDFLKFPDNLTFDYCGIMSHCFRQRRFRFVPITWREDDQVSNVKMASQAIQSMKLLLQFALNRKQFLENEKMECKVTSYKSLRIYDQEGIGGTARWR